MNFSRLTHLPCQLREAADYDPFLLFGANLKRELAGEPVYRRALRESGLPAPVRGQRGGGELGLCARAGGSGHRRGWGEHLGVPLGTGGAPEAGRGVGALGAQTRERGT